MTRYEFNCSPTTLSPYPILLQLADALPRKTIVDLSRGSRKQLRKKSSHKRKAAKSQSGPSVSNSKRARMRVEMEKIPNEQAGGLSRSSSMMSIEMEKIPNEQVGGLSHSSSMMSIESLVRKVSNIYHSLCLIKIDLACMYSRQENETQSTTSTSLFPRTRKDKLVTPVTATTSATMGIAKL